MSAFLRVELTPLRGGRAERGSRRPDRRQVFKVLSQDEDVGMEEMFKFFSKGGEWVQQRFVEQNHEAPCVMLVRSLAWV